MNLVHEGVMEARRTLLERTARGASLRRRLGGMVAFALFFLGFLIAVGLGRILVLSFVAAMAIAAIVTALVIARRVWPAVRVRARGRSLSFASSRRRANLGSRARFEVRAREARAVVRRVGRAIAQARRRVRRPRSSPPRRDGRRQEALRLNARGVEERRRGEYGLAVDSHRAALAVMRELGDPRGEALTLNNLALALANEGKDGAALEHFEHALAILRQLDDDEREGQVVANLGFLHGRRGRSEQAAECLRTALEKLRPDSHAYRLVADELRRAS